MRRAAARIVIAGAALLLLAGAAAGASVPAYGPNLEGFKYPYGVALYSFKTQAQTYVMAYMDVGPDTTGIGTGRTAVLLHGLKFCGATWAPTLAALHAAGFRVVVPDQLGFCKSSKPINYQYSFEQLAENTHALLGHIQAGRIVLIGHDLGGMLATRYALMFPNEVEQLVLVDPLGLEDWRREGVLYRTIDERYAMELATTPERIETEERTFYYGGHWLPRYRLWVSVLASLHQGGGRERFDWNQALISDMIFTQPVLYDLDRLAMPVLLVVGDLDRAAPFRESAPPALAAKLGDYPELARRAAKHIPHAQLIELPDVGHVPQIEAPERFNQALLHALGNPPAHR
ncbi:MAG: alpha/beta fold hydrolase [Steroidobacteraceae bacterium]